MSRQIHDPCSRKRLIADRLPDPTEILRASLVQRYTKCGKPGCKCMKGHKHGPSYYISVTIARGRTKQLYVRHKDVDTVRRWIANYDKMWQGLMQISEVNFEILRTLYQDRKPKPGVRQQRGQS